MVDGLAMIISSHNQNGRGEITFLGKYISFMNPAPVHIWQASLSKKSWLQHIWYSLKDSIFYYIFRKTHLLWVYEMLTTRIYSSLYLHYPLLWIGFLQNRECLASRWKHKEAEEVRDLPSIFQGNEI